MDDERAAREGDPTEWEPSIEPPHWLAADRRPDDVDDATVEAVGLVSEALEWVERARGRLYDFHQMSGHADLLLGEAVESLDEAGHPDLAESLRTHLIGRNVIEGRWTFQIIEEYDAVYWSQVRSFDDHVCRTLMGGARHVHESEMKDRRRTDGATGHERRPDPPSS